MLAVIIIFLSISALMAAILAMGAVPKIFQNAEVINQTQDETKNQTDIIIKQFQRENNTTHKILYNQNVSLQNQQKLIEDMDKTIEQNHVDIAMNVNVSQNIQNITDEILKISQEHKQVAKDHDRIVIEAQNTTNYVEQELERYGENSIEKLQKIVDNQEQIKRYFDILINQTKK